MKTPTTVYHDSRLQTLLVVQHDGGLWLVPPRRGGWASRQRLQMTDQGSSREVAAGKGHDGGLAGHPRGSGGGAMIQRPVYLVRLQPTPDASDPDGTRRLRMSLKRGLRDFGLRCVAVEPEADQTAVPATTIDADDRTAVETINGTSSVADAVAGIQRQGGQGRPAGRAGPWNGSTLDIR